MEATTSSVQVPIHDLESGHGAFRLPNGRLAYLASAKPERFASINQQPGLSQAPSPGNFDSFVEKHGQSDALTTQLRNRVRKCEGCGKPVAYTLSCCNGCGRDLSATPISFTNNVFVGFIYGIEKGPFPLTVSLRHEDQACLVFDDLLALSPCHLNAVPTSAYIPDWRVLLTDPARGLALINSLFDRCWQVVEEQFLTNEAWRAKTLNKAAAEQSAAALRAHVASGFNYPPSQYQLHLQFILPPFLPFQFALCLQGIHFTHGRFFPFEYVQAVLQLNEPLADASEMAIEDVILHFNAKGVDYDTIHRQAYDRTEASHRALAQWQSADFEGLGLLGPEQIVRPKDEGGVEKEDVEKEEQGVKLYAKKEGEGEEDPKAVQARDKAALQNYGRPYTAEGKPQGSFYGHAKSAPDAFPNF